MTNGTKVFLFGASIAIIGWLLQGIILLSNIQGPWYFLIGTIWVIGMFIMAIGGMKRRNEKDILKQKANDFKKQG